MKMSLRSDPRSTDFRARWRAQDVYVQIIDPGDRGFLKQASGPWGEGCVAGLEAAAFVKQFK
jgi:hypothetical protein